jgi:carbon-monoxide dehydrogenase medium subunit
MKPAPFKYHRVTTLEEATGLLATLENARLLAGGQSLMPMMNMRYVMVDHLIDLNEIPDMSGIQIDGARVRVGAMTRQRDIFASEILADKAPIFMETMQQVGHIPTRNRGTIGGSLSHLDPAAELPGMAALHNATITLSKRGSSRHVPMQEFALGYMTPCTEPDEILTEISFDFWQEGHGYDFREFAQRHGDFAIVGVGTLMTIDASNRIDRIACILIGIDYLPIRLTNIEADLLGQTPSEDLFRAAGEKTRERDMMEDALVPESYRKQLSSVLLRRSLTSAAQRAVGEKNV